MKKLTQRQLENDFPHSHKDAIAMRGCSANGEVDNSHYAKPLPWIGVYIAAGSLLCAAAMAFDAYSGFRRRKFWFPTRLFSLNATTLTLLAIATKFPVDLNTSMPGPADQLTKLSGTVFICTVTANVMPSLGNMDDSEILSNVVALGILVVTVVVNVGIQMGTRVIYVFLPEHAIVMFLMMVLLVLLASSALTVFTAKRLLEEKYISKHQDSEATDGSGDKFSLSKLKDHVKRQWLMAHTCSPQYVLGRSVTCTASGAFCLLGALVLTQALLRAIIRGPNVRFCSGPCDYQWSTKLVLVVQVAGVLIGSVAPAYRWFYAINFRSTENERWSCRDEFTVEKYWVQRLIDWKEAPLPFQISRSWLRKVSHDLNNFALAMLICLQKGVVLASKFVRLLSILPVGWLRQGARLLRTDSELGSPAPDDSELKGCVLHLDGEDDLVKLITKSEQKDTERWIQKGRRKQPEALFQLIKSHSNLSEGFKEVGAFDSAQGVPPLGPQEPPNCWALPLVTLVTIAAALPGLGKDQVKTLLRGVREGLKFVKIVETNLDEMGLVNMRGAADIVWLRVGIYRKWLDQDLRSLARGKDGDGKKVIEKIREAAEGEVMEFIQKLPSEPEFNRHCLAWPEKVLAANCMYRVCATILQDYDIGKHQTDADLFAWLPTVISDILGACLTNLTRAIFVECVGSRIEAREKSVRDAALSLGEAEGILQILEDPRVTARLPGSPQYIDDWRSRDQMGP